MFCPSRLNWVYFLVILLKQISSGAGRLQVGLTHFPQINRVAVNIIRGQKIGNDDVSFPGKKSYLRNHQVEKLHESDWFLSIR